MCDTVLIVGSGRNALDAAAWPRTLFSHVVAINNAWRVREDWSHLVHPEDFPQSRRPCLVGPDQKVIDYKGYIPHQNTYGGVVYAGGTMAFTAAYWVLGALRPKRIAFIGCDMVYPSSGQTHFYGTGAADPLRRDITLQSLEAKSARLALLAARQGCMCVNYSTAPSRQVFKRSNPTESKELPILSGETLRVIEAIRADEEDLGYFVESGRYWEAGSRFDERELARIDALWAHAFGRSSIVVT